MKRRMEGHDYTRPGIYMVTMTVEARRPLFGNVSGTADEPRIELTPLGCAVRDTWWDIPRHHPEVKVYGLQMMPDHLHGILCISTHLDGGLSRIIRGFKTGCGRHYRQLIAPLHVATPSQPTLNGAPTATHPQHVATTSQPTLNGTPTASHPQQVATPSQHSPKGSHPRHGLLFEPGFNDLVLRTDAEYRHWKRYLLDNPRRLLMRRERPSLLRPFFGLRVGSHTYNGCGNRELLTMPQRLAVRISRRLTGEQLDAEVARYLSAAQSGTVLVSPAISPGEKRVMRQAFDLGYPTIVVLRNGFTPLSKPHGEQFDACSAGRLLMLSAWPHSNERITLTAHDCQQMNLMALELSGQ